MNFCPRGAARDGHAYQLAPSACPNCARLRRRGAQGVVAAGVDQMQGAAPPRRREAPSLAPSSKPAATGFAFGEDSLLDVVRALRTASLALLAEDGEDDTVISVVASAQDVTTEQVEFLMEHAARLHVALGADDYGSVYASMRKIVLDNTDPAMPALSVSTKGVGRPRGTRRTSRRRRARARRRVGARAGHTLTCRSAAPLERCERGGVLRRAGATEASVELAKLAGLAGRGHRDAARVGAAGARRARRGARALRLVHRRPRRVQTALRGARRTLRAAGAHADQVRRVRRALLPLARRRRRAHRARQGGRAAVRREAFRHRRRLGARACTRSAAPATCSARSAATAGRSSRRRWRRSSATATACCSTSAGRRAAASVRPLPPPHPAAAAAPVGPAPPPPPCTFPAPPPPHPLTTEHPPTLHPRARREDPRVPLCRSAATTPSTPTRRRASPSTRASTAPARRSSPISGSRRCG